MAPTPDQINKSKRRPKSVKSPRIIDIDSEQITKLATVTVGGVVILGFVIIVAIISLKTREQPQYGPEETASATPGKQVATDLASPTSGATLITTNTPGPTVTPSVQISNIRFCNLPCDRPGALAQTTYPARTKDVYFAWDYSGMQQGVEYTRDWSNQGDIWVQYRCTWQGPRKGTFTRKLYDHNGGLRSGTWTMRVVVEGQLLVTTSIEVLGNNTYWDPFTEPQPCPDW